MKKMTNTARTNLAQVVAQTGNSQQPMKIYHKGKEFALMLSLTSDQTITGGYILQLPPAERAFLESIHPISESA